MNQAISDRQQAYYEARRDHEEKKAIATTAAKLMAKREAELVDAMIDAGVQNFKLDDGSMVSIRKRVSISCTQANEAQVREWLLDRTGDDRQFIEQKVSKKAVEDYVKQSLEEGSISKFEVPEFLRLNQHPCVAVRGWNKEA